MPSPAIRPDQLQHLLDTLGQDYKALIAAERTPTYYGPQTHEAARAEARKALSESVTRARDTVSRFGTTQDPALRPLLSKLVVETELADDALKHPELLRR
jgi:hypothetical protein